MTIFTIEDLKQSLEKIYFDKIRISFSKTLKERARLTDIFAFKNIYKIDNLRGLVKFYRGMDNEMHNIEPSIKRLYRNIPYDLYDECKYINAIKNNVFFNQYKKDDVSIDLLARMQHYNYKSRLVDVTFNFDVAAYMASCSSFKQNGKVIEFAHESNPFIDKNITNVLKRYHYINHPSDNLKFNLGLINYLIDPNKHLIIPKKYESQAVIIIDAKTFKHNSESHDLRYNAQNGAFIFFLNQQNFTSNNPYFLSDLDTKYFSNNAIYYRQILNEDKLSFLYILATYGTTNVSIYPDKDTSHEINKINAKVFAMLKNTSNNSWFNEAIDDYLYMFNHNATLNNHNINHLKNLCNHYIASSNIIEFLLTDYISLLEYRNKLLLSNNRNSIRIFNRSVNKLVKESNNKLFNRLIISYS